MAVPGANFAGKRVGSKGLNTPWTPAPVYLITAWYTHSVDLGYIYIYI